MAGWIAAAALVGGFGGLVFAVAPGRAPQDAPAAATDDAGVAVGGSGGGISHDPAKSSSFDCTVTRIVDGDTLVCAEPDVSGKPIRVRISGISARERDGSCRDGHPCPDATAEAATAMLEGLAGGRVLACAPDNRTYDRIAAFCRSPDGVDISCAMVESGTAAIWPRHWGDHRCG